jgi:hypothetical protein
MNKVFMTKSKSLVLIIMILTALSMMYGCSGDTGAQGPAGSNRGTVSGTVMGPDGSGLAGVTVSNNITSDTATTDSTGHFSISLPIGTYTLSFKMNGYNTATAPVTVAAAGASSSVPAVTLSESASGLPSVAMTSDANEVGFGNTVNLTATVTPGSNGGTVASYKWTVVPPSAGSAQGLGHIVGAGSTAVLTMPLMNDPVNFRGAFDGTVTTIGGQIYQTEPYDYKPTVDLLGNPAPAGTIVPADGNFVAKFVPENRFGVLPLLADTRAAVTPQLVVTDSLGGTVTVRMPATQPLYATGVQPGVKDVAIGEPVYVNSGHDGGSAWTLTKPTGSQAALSSTTDRYPFFVPDVVGAYTLTEGANSMVIYAGNFVGVVANSSSAASYTTKIFDLNNPEDKDKAGMWYDTSNTAYWPNGPTGSTTYTNWPVVVPDSGCTTCHFNNVVVNGLTAPDTFTPWALTAHATFFARGIDGITSNYGSCLTCHTVGYDLSFLANNGGFDDAAAANGFVYPASRVAGNWGKIFANAASAKAGKLSNIQCENCHGPQDTGTQSAHISGLAGGTSGAAGGTRVNFASEVCGVCHASGTGHHNYSEWLRSVNPGQPGPEVTINPTPFTPSFTVATVAGVTGHGHSNLNQFDATGYSGHARSTDVSCSRCHTAEGFAAYVDQLSGFDPNSNPAAAGNLSASAIVWTKDNVHTQTCTACHDPHDDSNPNQLRVYDSVPMTIVGVGASGLGKGVICILCHNSRNGTKPDGTTFLHEDTDPYAITVFDTPHDNTQGEVLLGRDAFFMTGSIPLLSKHANVKDSCVGCHMTLNPAKHLSHGASAGSGHQFFINDGDRPDLCANCHGSGDAVTGQGLVAQTQNQFAQLSSTMGPAMLFQLLNTNLGIVGGTIYVGSNHTAIAIASITAISFNNTAADPTKLTAAGASSFYFYTGGAAAAASGGLSTITLDAAGTTPVFSTNGIFRKAVWNYQLIGKDYSYGIHNPSFATAVMSNTIAKINMLLTTANPTELP